MLNLDQTDEDGMGTGHNDIESEGGMYANIKILHTLGAILRPVFTDTALRCESMKQALHLTEFEGGRLPSTDMKIQAQLRDKIKSVELGRKKERRRPVEGNKGWPMWPALSLEHIAADEAKVWGKRGHHVNVLIRFAGPRGTWCICIYVQVSNLGQNRLSE